MKRRATHRSAVVHTSIQAAPEHVLAFLGDPRKWPGWAPWLRSVTRLSDREWAFDTEAGRMQLRFVEPNTLGVLDHQVTLESGVTVLNFMRVVPNHTGSELVMVLLQSSVASTAEFERDVTAVTEDFARIKRAVEQLSEDRES